MSSSFVEGIYQNNKGHMLITQIQDIIILNNEKLKTCMFYKNVNLWIYVQVIINKGAKNIQWEKDP